MDLISICVPYILYWSSDKSGRDPQKRFRIIARGDSFILQNIGVMSSVTGS